MKKLFTTLLFIIVAAGGSFAQQNILIQNDFTGYNGLLPTVAPGWYYSWNDTSSSTKSFYTSVATCGIAPPAYKFVKDSVYIISPSFTAADSVSFWMKGNAGTVHDTNTFFVYTSADSSTWNLLWSMDSISTVATTVSLPLSSTDHYLKFYYGKYLSGFNVGLDDIKVFNYSVGIRQVDKPEFSIFPNPSKGLVNVDLNANQLRNASIIVSNILGNELKKVTLKKTDTNYQLDLSEFQEGIYFVKVKSDSGENIQRIILKK
jgi:hypothetical protein